MWERFTSCEGSGFCFFTVICLGWVGISFGLAMLGVAGVGAGEVDKYTGFNMVLGFIGVIVWVVGLFAYVFVGDSVPSQIVQQVVNNMNDQRKYVSNTTSGNNSPIFNDVKGSTIDLQIIDSSLKAPLGWDKARTIVQSSGNQKAVQEFNDMNSEFAKDKPDRYRLRGLWDCLRQTLPAIKDVAELAEDIIKWWS